MDILEFSAIGEEKNSNNFIQTNSDKSNMESRIHQFKWIVILLDLKLDNRTNQ